MSKGRGNRVQRALFAAVREESEAAGLTCRLDCTQRGAEQHAIVELPRGGSLRIALHGTPRDADREVAKVRTTARRRIERALKGA